MLEANRSFFQEESVFYYQILQGKQPSFLPRLHGYRAGTSQKRDRPPCDQPLLGAECVLCWWRHRSHCNSSMSVQPTVSLLIYCIVTESSSGSMQFTCWEKKEMCWENVCDHVDYNQNTDGKKEEDVFIVAKCVRWGVFKIRIGGRWEGLIRLA